MPAWATPLDVEGLDFSYGRDRSALEEVRFGGLPALTACSVATVLARRPRARQRPGR